MNGHARQGAPGRSFQLLAQVPPPSAPAERTSVRVSGGAARLTAETARQLQTLLSICCMLVDAASGEIAAQLAGRWIILVESGPPGSDRGRHGLGAPDSSGVHAESGPYVVRLPGAPPLAMILTTTVPVSPSNAKLLSGALALAFPILRDGEAHQREEDARQRVLHVQAELAHELRTPLTAISGFAQLLQRPGQLDEARRRSYAGIAVTESQQVTAIIDHLVATLQAEAEALGRGAPPDRGAQEGDAHND